MLSFNCRRFSSLSLEELYAILALRAEVFVVEQNCAYLDVDEKDHKAYHILGTQNGELIAYARVLPKGVSYRDSVSIGRIVIAHKERGKNYGHNLVQYAITVCSTQFPNEKVKISAQAHLEKFYNVHGFKLTGKTYLEDNIPHIAMIKMTNK